MALVQDNVASATYSGASTTTMVVNVTKATTAGNFMVCTWIAVAAGVASAIDSRGNTWTPQVSKGDAGGATERVGIITAPVTTGLQIGDTITLTFGSPETNRGAIVSEWNRLTTADKTASANGTSSTPVTAATTTTAQAYELLVGVIGATTAVTLSSPGTGYAALTAIPHPATPVGFPIYRFVNATGTYTAGGTISGSTAWSAVLTTFKGVAPVNTVAPVVSGSAPVGNTLSTTNGTWTDDGAPTYTYAWQRDGSPIGGATSSTYLTQAADVGHAISCIVTDTDTGGTTAQATSNSVTVTSVTGGFFAIFLPAG